MSTPSSASGTGRTLPVASGTQVRAKAREIFAAHRGAVTVMLLLHALSALAAVIGPRLLGAMVQSVRDGTTAGHINRLAVLLAVSLVAQTLFTFVARRASFVLAETVFAELREGFLERVLRLPLSTVERAG